MITVQKYKINLIKESNARYNLDSKKVDSPLSVYRAIKEIEDISTYAEEVLLLICLDTKNQIIGVHEVSRGNINTSLVHPREIFKRALINNSASILLAHNHPSGDPTPSKDDINITLRIIECGKLLGVELLDHVILGDNKYSSLKEKGII